MEGVTSASVAPGGPGLSGPVGGGPITELLLPYDPSALVDTVRRRRRRLISRLISLGISLALLGGIYAWQHRSIPEQGGAYWVFTGIVLALSLIPLLVVLLGFLRSRAELRAVPSGIAVRMGRPGVVVGTAFARWTDVVALEVVPGGLGRADRLRLRTRAGSLGVVPLDQVVVHPATLDGTARAYSAGRQGVDLSRLDN
jgi:hypothetical protein